MIFYVRYSGRYEEKVVFGIIFAFSQNTSIPTQNIFLDQNIPNNSLSYNDIPLLYNLSTTVDVMSIELARKSIELVRTSIELVRTSIELVRTST